MPTSPPSPSPHPPPSHQTVGTEFSLAEGACSLNSLGRRGSGGGVQRKLTTTTEQLSSEAAASMA